MLVKYGMRETYPRISNKLVGGTFSPSTVHNSNPRITTDINLAFKALEFWNDYYLPTICQFRIEETNEN